MNYKLLCAVSIVCVSASHAEPKIQMSPGVKGGVLSTQITSTLLTDAEKKRISPKMATATVYAGTVDININRNQHGMARSVHSVCFETWLTTEADYKFTLDVGGRQIVMQDHIVIPNDRKTCVQHELYQDVSFSAPGAYSYYAITTGTTQMAGEKRANSRGTIRVN